MKRSGGTKSSLFLIEFILVLFFFLLVCTFCVRLFSLAELTSRRSKNLSIAQNLAQSFAEALKGTDGSPEEMAGLLPELSFGGGQYQAWYDLDWKPCACEEAAYSLEAPTEISVFLKKADLTILDLKEEEPLFSLTLTFYNQNAEEEPDL